MMNIAFSGLKPNKTFIYMDDLIVVGCSENHMLENLKSVFEICRATNLKLHPDKCKFFDSQVTFLGHKCTDQGILPDESKFDKILSYPKPTNADECKRFVAFVNYYRRFIPNFSNHATHITKLTRKKLHSSGQPIVKMHLNTSKILYYHLKYLNIQILRNLSV